MSPRLYAFLVLLFTLVGCVAEPNDDLQTRIDDLSKANDELAKENKVLIAELKDIPIRVHRGALLDCVQPRYASVTSKEGVGYFTLACVTLEHTDDNKARVTVRVRNPYQVTYHHVRLSVRWLAADPEPHWLHDIRDAELYFRLGLFRVQEGVAPQVTSEVSRELGPGERIEQVFELDPPPLPEPHYQRVFLEVSVGDELRLPPP
jgi:hypothetical protein